jgi:predicted O-methyltransferase YrrM
VSDSSNSYDTVAYPSAIFRACHPDRMAVVARLHGLTPPPLDTARVLEVGGGDGLNALAIGAAYPNAEVINFDLAQVPIARGRRWAEIAGITNVRQELLDILEAADRLDGEFDYIIAHGVYAWVPEPVGTALMGLIGRRLSANGVALVSYNTLPGGYVRQAIREMVFHRVGAIEDLRGRVAAARAFLADFVETGNGNDPLVGVMRSDAKQMLARPDEVILHDELGEVYRPSSLSDIAAVAAAEGLSYLADAGRQLGQDFLAPDDVDISEAALVHRDQVKDYLEGRYFRTSLFVRREAHPSRKLDVNEARSLWVSAYAQEADNNEFRVGGVHIVVGDPQLAGALRRLIGAWPGRILVSELFDDEEHIAALIQLSDAGIGDFHVGPPPFSLAAGDRPLASPLVRMQIAEGHKSISTLDHRAAEMGDDRARQLVALLDGEHDLAELDAAWTEIQNGLTAVSLAEALRIAARTALLVR